LKICHEGEVYFLRCTEALKPILSESTRPSGCVMYRAASNCGKQISISEEAKGGAADHMCEAHGFIFPYDRDLTCWG
jgi:hypothetical protein